VKSQKIITILVLLIAVFAAIAASAGVFSNAGTGIYEYESIRGETVDIYGRGLYKHMSADVAPQGIAQDVITLFAAIPLLIISLIWARKNSLRGRFLLSGVLGYFLVTYLFYLVMGMYNALFLVYVILLGLSFFAFSVTLFSFPVKELPDFFTRKAPVKLSSAFLIFNAVSITVLWLEVVVPPLLDGTIVPVEAEHYTTLIVQGLDLALLLPVCFVSAVLYLKKYPIGYLLAPVYLIFLSLMMLALTSKVIAMGLLGQQVIPVIFIIPVFMLISIVLATLNIRAITR